MPWKKKYSKYNIEHIQNIVTKIASNTHEFLPLERSVQRRKSLLLTLLNSQDVISYNFWFFASPFFVMMWQKLMRGSNSIVKLPLPHILRAMHLCKIMTVNYQNSYLHPLKVANCDSSWICKYIWEDHNPFLFQNLQIKVVVKNCAFLFHRLLFAFV